MKALLTTLVVAAELLFLATIPAHAYQFMFGLNSTDTEWIGFVTPEEYGAIGDGITDDTTALQAMFDAIEDNYTNVRLAKNYLINGTLYIGSCYIYGGGTITIKVDASWSQLGTSFLNGEGAILCKSTEDALSGGSPIDPAITTIKLRMTDITIIFTRTVGGGTTVKTALMLENVSSGSLEHCRLDANGTITSNPMDIRRNVKNFTVFDCDIVNSTAASAGGTWVRNYDTVVGSETENITLDSVRWEHNSGDEALAIFAPSAVGGLVQDINVDNCSIYVYGIDRAKVISVDSNNAAGVVKRVSFSNLSVKTATGTNVTSIVLEKDTTAGTVEGVSLVNGRFDVSVNALSGNVQVVRGLGKVSNTTVDISGVTNNANVITAYYSVGQLNNSSNSYPSGVSHANLKTYASQFSGEITQCRLEGSISGARIVANSIITDGRIIDCEKIVNNTISVDVDYTFLVLSQGIVRTYEASHIVGNRWDETYGSELSTDEWFYITHASKYFINDNYYNGKREKFGDTWQETVLFSGNMMDTGVTQTKGMPNAGWDMTDVSTSGTGEDTLKDTIIYADWMGISGGLKVTAAGTKSGVSGNKTGKLHWGSASYTVHAAANNADDWTVTATIVNTATGAQRITWEGPDGTGYESASEDTTANVTVKITWECADGADSATQTMWNMETL